MSVVEYTRRRNVRLAGLGIVAAIAVLAAVSVVFDISIRRIFTPGYIDRTIRFATPIALAAIGGLYAEKSGVFNIGLEGFMIIGAISTALVMYALGGTSPSQFDIWTAIVATIVISLLLTALYAVLLVRYQADQIVAGLAVWFIGLGFSPFLSIVIWDRQRSDPLGTIDYITVPGLEELPYLGRVVFSQSPLVWMTLLLVIVSWLFLYRTRYGYWIQAAGENPEALDTAGISVNRVRYAALIFSGVMAGFGGAVLLAHTGTWNGTGETMVEGRGWIGIVAYLFGNYNPIGAALAALLFAAVDQLQIQLQTIGIRVSSNLIGTLPYVVVIIVLTLWGKTRMPAAVGESYESED